MGCEQSKVREKAPEAEVKRTPQPVAVPPTQTPAPTPTPTPAQSKPLTVSITDTFEGDVSNTFQIGVRNSIPGIETPAGGRISSPQSPSTAKKRALDLSLTIPAGGLTVPQERGRSSRSLSINEELAAADGASILKALRKNAPVHRVVLTGGPCAGKSTSLGSLQARLLTAGFNVYCVPEAATLLVNGGLTWTDMTEDKATLYQLALLRTQIALEDAFLDIAKASSKPAVILCDRGTMDGRAYCSETAWQRIMDLGGYTVEQLRDERYDAVIHMVTAAIGAESFYNLENTARTETIEQARAIDEVLRQKYVGHPKLKIVNNDTPFQEKVDKVWTFISELIGSGKPKTCYRRYLLSKCPTDKDITVPFERVELRITILQQSVLEDIHLLIRRKQGKAMYFTYQNISRNNGEKQRVEHRLTQKEYRSLALQAHATHIPIVKENLSFTYAEHYFELGVFQDPAEWRGKAVLYVETDKSPEDVLRCMPPFISIEREVTKDDEFSSYTISSSGVGLTSPTLLSKEQRDKMKF